MRMRALVRDESEVQLVRIEAPSFVATREVIVDVVYAGICRTDLAVADGTLPVAPGRILGHELSGIVASVGAGVDHVTVGAAVTAIPFTGHRWLGIDLDGAFADRIRLPASCVVQLPAGMPLILGAYVEPVAAALGPLPFITRGAHVLVAGDGRIAELTARVLVAHGAVVARTPGSAGRFDAIIEHGGDPAELLGHLRRGGTLILKSRAHRSITLDPGELVARDLVVRGSSHGSFAAAIDWLHARRITVDDLLAPPRPLDDFRDVFAAARDESRKQMFAVGRVV